MNLYRVIGTYGIQSGQCYDRVYRAKSAENARKRFIREIKKDAPSRWDRIENNIEVIAQ